MAGLPAKKMPTVQNLQVLRLIAAVMVLFSHVQHELTAKGGGGSLTFRPFDPVFWPGGVDIFFVISGFIMFFIGHCTFAVPGGARDFMLKRLVRIVPIYWIFTTLMLVSILVFGSRIAHSDLSLANVVLSYFFVPSRNAYGELLPVLALGWTLNFEMMFYVVFSLGLLAPLRKGLLFVICVIGVLAILSVLNLSRFAALEFWTNAIVLEFLYGIGLASIYLTGFRIKKWVSILFIIIAIALMLLVKAMRLDVEHWDWRFIWMGGPAFVLCAALTLVSEEGPLRGVRKLFVLGGDASYVLYLSHPFVINVVEIIWDKFGFHGSIYYIFVAMAVAVLSSVFMHIYFESILYRRLVRAMFPSLHRSSMTNSAV